MWEDTEEHDRAMQRAVDEHGWCYLHSALADDCRECMNEQQNDDEKGAA